MAKNWWEYRDARQRLAAFQKFQQEGSQPDGGGIFKGVLGDTLDVVAKPFAEAGKFALDKLGDYNRRFTTPTAAWLSHAIADINEEKTDPWGILTQNKATAFGGHVDTNRRRPNPLRAWGGDDDEIAYSEEVMASMNPYARFILEMVADPSNWVTMGTGAAAKGFIRSGTLMLGAKAAPIESALNARNLSRMGARGLIPGAKKFVKPGEIEDDFLDFLKLGSAGDPARNAAAKSLIAAGGILNVISGIPEVLLDTFLKGAVRPLTESIPGMRLAIEETSAGPRVRIKLDQKLADISPRSQLDNNLTEAADLLRLVERDVLTMNPNTLHPEQEIIRRIADPSLDTSNYSPFAVKAHETIHSGGINLDDLLLDAQNGQDFYNLRRQLVERMDNAKAKQLGLATKENIQQLPNWQRLIARAANMETGFRFFNNKLAATWLHGALFSPFYVTQNALTDPLFAGMTRMGMTPKMARAAYGGRMSQLYDNFLGRTGIGKRGKLAEIDQQPRKVDPNAEVYGEQPLAQTMFSSGRAKTEGGMVVGTVDRLAAYAGRSGKWGRALAAGMKVGIRGPHMAAQALDEGFSRAVMEQQFDRLLNARLALHPNATVANLYNESNELYWTLKELGVPDQQAKALSLSYKNSATPQEFLESAREIANTQPGDLLKMAPLNDNTIIPQEIADKLRKVINDNYGAGRQALVSGQKLEKFDVQSSAFKDVKVRGKEKIEGVDDVKRVHLPRYVISNVRDQRSFMRDSSHAFIDEHVPSVSAGRTFHGLIDETHNSLERLEDKVIKLMLGKKATAQDVKYYGDMLLRLSVNRQAVTRFIDDAVTALPNDPTAIVRWQRARSNVSAGITRMEREMDEMLEMARQARTSALKGNRKPWGDFREKYDPGNVLPENPDLDAFYDYMTGAIDEASSTFINSLYTGLRVPGSDISVRANWFKTMFDEIDNFTREGVQLADNHVATNSNLMKAALRISEEMPQNNPEIAKQLLTLQQKSSNEALDMMLERMGDFYVGNTNFDEMMMWAFPFARFGSRALSIAPRAASRIPGLIPMFYRWQHASEKEMHPLQSWMPLVGNISINPFGALAPYQQYEALTDPRVFAEGDIEMFMKSLGTAGFAPGPGLTAILGQMGQFESEGNLVPAQRLIRGLELTGLPYSDVPDAIMTRVANAVYGSEGDPVLDRETERVLADQGLNPGEVARDSTEWKLARREAIKQGTLNFGLAGATLREVPPERIEYAKREAQALASAGISTDEQIAINRAGKSPWSLLNQEQKDAVIAQIGEEEFSARTAITPPLLSMRERNQWHSIQTYYALNNISSNSLDLEIRFAGQALMDGEISGEQYRERKKIAFATYSAVKEAQKRAILAETHGADIMDNFKFTKQQVDALWTKLRDDIRLSAGRDINNSKLPEDEALDDYRDIDPALFGDAITGEIDWDLWEQSREAFLAFQPPNIMEYILRNEERRQERDPIEQLFEVAKQQMSEYRSIPRYTSVSPEDQEEAYQGIRDLATLQDLGYNKQKALLMIQQDNPTRGILARVALKSGNPARREYWKSHPLLQLFFSDDVIPQNIIQ